jgi:hypothetical protein
MILKYFGCFPLSFPQLSSDGHAQTIACTASGSGTVALACQCASAVIASEPESESIMGVLKKRITFPLFPWSELQSIGRNFKVLGLLGRFFVSESAAVPVGVPARPVPMPVF